MLTRRIKADKTAECLEILAMLRQYQGILDIYARNFWYTTKSLSAPNLEYRLVTTLPLMETVSRFVNSEEFLFE